MTTRVRRTIRESDYARLLAVRTGLRRFERWSSDQAAEHGLTSPQHQLLLAIRGHQEPQGPTIRQAADYLLTRHNSTVELADRCERLGLIARIRDAEDHRVVRLQLTAEGERVVAELATVHLAELQELATLFETLVGALAD